MLDSLKWRENRFLSYLLLQKIDEILKKNKLSIDNISTFSIISDIPKNWTSARIAEITLKSLVLAKKNRLC